MRARLARLSVVAMTIYAVPEIETRRDALVERLFSATSGAFDLFAASLGDRLGLYRALAADVCGAGYAREWLEQQAVTGVLEFEDGHDMSDPVSVLSAARACSPRTAA